MKDKLVSIAAVAAAALYIMFLFSSSPSAAPADDYDPGPDCDEEIKIWIDEKGLSVRDISFFDNEYEVTVKEDDRLFIFDEDCQQVDEL